MWRRPRTESTYPGKCTKYEEYAYGGYEVVEYGIHRKLYEGP